MIEDVSIEENELRIILKNFLDFLEPDENKILGDLRQFDFLVDRVEPYHSLHCWNTNERPLDMGYCLEICPAKRVSICMDMFYKDNYLVKKVDRDES